MRDDKIPAFSLTEQVAALRPELEDAWHRVLDSGQYILGPEVEAFEQEVQSLLGVPAVGVPMVRMLCSWPCRPFTSGPATRW